MRVQDGVVEVEDDHRLLLVEQLLDVLLLLLPKQLAADQHVLGGLLVEQVAAHLADVLLGYLLHAELASSLHHLLVAADHPPQTHHDGAVVGLALVLLPLDEESRLGQVGHPHLNVFGSAHLGGRCKLLVFYYTPAEVLLEVLSAQPIHAAELPQRNLHLLLLVVLPEGELAGLAGGD